MLSLKWFCQTRKSPVAILAAVSMLLTNVSLANVVGADTQNFNPTPDGLDFVTVQSWQSLSPGVINFGLFLNDAVNTLPYFDNSDGGRTRYSDSLLSADINVGIGLLPGWEVGVSAPQVLAQDVSDEGYHGQFDEKGNTEVRVDSKLQVLGDEKGGLALIGTASENRIKNNPYVGDSSTPIYSLEAAVGGAINKLAMALNVGYRWRNSGDKVDPSSPIDPLPDQYIASGALSYLFSSIDTKLIFELYGSIPAQSVTNNTDRASTSSEALLGLKHDFTTHLSGHIGAGTAIVRGLSTPDYRVYAGLNYALGPVFSKPPPARVEPGRPATLIKADPFTGPPKPQEKIVIHDILFEFDSDSLVIGGPDETLSRLVAYLNRKPVFTKLIIEGHTDSIGSDAYNMDLSRRRANTIKHWLVERYHLPASKIEAIGKGKRFPIADNGNYQGRQLNRRVEFTIFRNVK